MNFGYAEQFGNEEEFSFDSVLHLKEFAEKELDMDVDELIGFGLDESMEQEQMMAVAEQIKEAIEEELKQRQLQQIPPCYIGPYAAGICTICGGRQP